MQWGSSDNGIRLSWNGISPVGRITLDGSKSISNRVLVIRALSGMEFPIENLSTSADSATLRQLLSADGKVLDAGHAGTTFRFLTAYLCLRPGQQVLTGSDRMKRRPIGDLVQTLSQLGADIRYLEREGYPPLEIGEFHSHPETRNIKINASVSSQFISSLLMIAPCLPGGLSLELEGRIVSMPYIDMTLSLMALELSTPAVNNREAASIVSIFIILFTVTGALLVRYFGRRVGVRHDMHAGQGASQSRPQKQQYRAV